MSKIVGFEELISNSSIRVQPKCVYHGSFMTVKNPKIKENVYTKDFGCGFYVTGFEQQAIKFTGKFRKGSKVVNIYNIFDFNNLKTKIFKRMDDEWLDFIANCRIGIKHDYDIVEGPMADDQVWAYVNEYLAGGLDRDYFWKRTNFCYPTRQICFCTDKALERIKFVESYEVN